MANKQQKKQTYSRFEIIAEFWDFVKHRKRWWLGPILGILLLMSVLIVLTETTALAPFIYSLF